MQTRYPNLLADGFRLAVRNWPCLLWAYAANLLFAVLAAVPFSATVAPSLDHSLAAQQIAGNLDVAYVTELFMHLGKADALPGALRSATWLSLLEFPVMLLLTAGTLHIYISGERPRLATMLRAGVDYFWRFVRILLITAVVAGPILGVLSSARAAFLRHSAQTYSERPQFDRLLVTGLVLLVIALLLRLWFDVVEVYTVRNGIAGDRRVRKTLLPSLRLLFRNFGSLAGSFFLAGTLGVLALLAFAFLWKDLIPARAVPLAFVVSQLGLFLLLAARFWQRGIVTSLVLARAPLAVVPEAVVVETPDSGTDVPVLVETPAVETGVPVLAESSPVHVEEAPAAATATGAEPTLAELVQRLHKEPWATPQISSPAHDTLFPRPATAAENGSAAAADAQPTPPPDPAAKP